MVEKNIFSIQGMHCKACVLLTESEIGELPNVVSVKADLAHGELEVSGEFGEKTRNQIAEEFTHILNKRGYVVSAEQQTTKTDWSDFRFALPIALGILLVFVLLQKANIVNFVSAGEMTYGTAFAIGVVASLSSCMAIVGGLVLSMSATNAKKGEGRADQVLFHIGRIVSFFVFGGVVGVIGTAFTLSPFAVFALSILVGAVMLMLGINLLDVFPWARRFQLGMPKSISRMVSRMTKKESSFAFAPFLIGAVTFFLPCGFTQSMQVYTLTTHSFWAGGLTMLVFALGTLPVLSLVSFGALSITKSRHLGVFFKTAGLVVIAFALFNMLNGFVVAGIISPVF